MRILIISMFFFTSLSLRATGAHSALFDAGIYLIPYPREVVLGGEDFAPGPKLSIVLDRNASEQDRFAASEMAAELQEQWGIRSAITDTPLDQSIVLTRKGVSKKITGLSEKKAEQGYQLTTAAHQVVIRAKGATGLFYGTQTLLQILKRGPQGVYIPAMEITDWPDIPERACHYDTKHHQDKREYVEGFIRDLARYKINMLVWEWEDKFEYPSHPEIGAPGAFTMEEMQEITRYARKYHVQLVPLVQGLGHVSYILKWPRYSHLREIPASNWEFCPLKEGTYALLNDLWQDAIRATPGSEYIHIGSDETYELGLCEQCQQKTAEIGKSGLYHLFVQKGGKPLQEQGRKVMSWERPMGWTVGDSPARGISPLPDLVLTESYGYETPDFKYASEAKALGFELFTYDPNPDVVPLIVPNLFELENGGKPGKGCLEQSYEHLTSTAESGLFEGMINTSWDDAGIHNQMWMMSFVNAAEWSWNSRNPGLEEFIDTYFLNYYGEQASGMRELFLLLNEGGYFYFQSFERRVWHYGDIGKTHVPDLPRGDNLEYDEYWNREYAERVDESRVQVRKMERALEIISTNQGAGIKHGYDLELFTSIADLVSHTGKTYLALSGLEMTIKEAHNQMFISPETAAASLEAAVGIIDANLAEREEVYQQLVAIWEKTRLPKGFSTDEKEFFHRQDRARHFAFRRPDMSYLIYDEELLGLEDYKEKLLAYMKWFKSLYGM
ncbi:MAG: beta-N-acetylhexosaminidase [Bacteroidota bacterium]